MKNIIIIGAGPAGLMSAVTILENKIEPPFHIHIFEKNVHPGKKLLISGGGRCNITTALEDKKILATKYVRGWDFIKRAMGKFSPKKCYEWFESHELPLKVEGDNRVFPVSDDGHDVLRVFESIFAKYRDKISIHYSEGVSRVTKSDSQFTIETSKNTYSADSLIIATGGNAYSQTGSTGDGYSFAQALGHSISLLGPSLSSFLTKEEWLQRLSGLSFESARIGKLHGPILLTHFGISGPLAFMVSSELAWNKIEKNTPKGVLFSPIGSMRYSDWETFLKNSFQNHPKKFITSILSEILPRRFAEAFVKEYFSHIEETFTGSIARIDREKISKLLGDGISLTLLERRPGDEFVTAGGVNTDEIDSETMESKKHKNLYFAGEVLNVDGYTGGFSLQICWASGYVAGKSVFFNDENE